MDEAAAKLDQIRQADERDRERLGTVLKLDALNAGASWAEVERAMRSEPGPGLPPAAWSVLAGGWS